MKLSEAIRTGATHGPQLFGTMFDNKGGSCALGAAFGAVIGKWTLEEFKQTRDSLESQFPALNEQILDAMGNATSLRATLLSMNDHYHMTREQIAEWLETKGL